MREEVNEEKEEEEEEVAISHEICLGDSSSAGRINRDRGGS